MAKRNLAEAFSRFEQAGREAEARNDLRLMLRTYQALVAYHLLLGGEKNTTNAIRLSNRIVQLAAEGDYFAHELIGHHLRGPSFFEAKDLQRALDSFN